MNKILSSVFCFLLAIGASAQPVQGGGYALPLDYPVVYEGPDVVFRQIDDHLWVGSGHVMSSETLYIVEGDDRAVLIDTGTSIPGLDGIVSSITSKPYDVILTHVHPDHAGGCNNFDEIWICKADEASLPEMAPGFDGKVNYLEDGQVIDLGGRTLEVLFTPGHTAGSVTFMDKANHYGFSGDSFGNGNLLLFTDFATMKASCAKTLEWMRKNDIYFLYNGHFMNSNQETTKRIYDLGRICDDLMSGKVKGDPNPGGTMGLDFLYVRDGVRVNYSSEMADRIVSEVQRREQAYRLPPLPESVVYTLPASYGGGFDGRSYNFAPQFFIYPDGKLDSGAAEALVAGLGIPGYSESDHASAMVINPVGEKYDPEADFELFVELFNLVSRSGNLKVVGIGEGADFVNEVLLPRAADHIAGILTIDGKAVKPGREKSYGVPAYVSGKNAARAAKAYIAADGAVACGERDGVKIYENSEEPLLRVAVNPAPAEDLGAVFADAWDKIFSRNYRFNNYGHTHYTGARFGQYGPYELEPYMIPENFGIVRNIVAKERPGEELPWLWYEYWPEELLEGAPEHSVPVVVLLHGNTNDPRTQAETSGFIELAAEEKFFVVEMEWQGSASAGPMGHDGVEAVLYELCDKYPQLDPSRIYCEGLSAGSITSTQLGIVKSHVFAAVGGHSGGLLGSFNRGAYGLRSILDEAEQKRGCVEMPYCGVFGTADEVVPFYNEENFRDNNYILAWNAYLTMGDLDTIDSIDFDVDPVFGFSLSDRETIKTVKGAGISMETGVVYKGDVPMMRLVAVDDYGHWNFKPAARVMWDFFKHFSRDQKTLKLVYMP